VGLLTVVLVLAVFVLLSQVFSWLKSAKEPSKAALYADGTSYVRPIGMFWPRVIATFSILVLGATVMLVKRSNIPLPVKAPASPVALRVWSSTELPVFDSGETRHARILSIPTPCDVRGAKHVQEKEHQNLREPSFVPDVKRFVFRTVPDHNDDIDILVEASITNRGIDSVVRHWRLCIPQNREGIYYLPQEVTADDLLAYSDKTSLEWASIQAPIKRGNAMTGWLRFRVPRLAINDPEFIAGLAFRDFVGDTYSIIFSPPRSGSKTK
jgi:hypothetical protein